MADQSAVERNSEDSVVEAGSIPLCSSSTRLVAAVGPRRSMFGMGVPVRTVPMLTAARKMSATDCHIAAHGGGRCRLPR